MISLLNESFTQKKNGPTTFSKELEMLANLPHAEATVRYATPFLRLMDGPESQNLTPWKTRKKVRF